MKEKQIQRMEQPSSHAVAPGHQFAHLQHFFTNTSGQNNR